MRRGGAPDETTCLAPCCRRLSVVLVCAAPALAQTATTASMSGRITDAQGSVLPGATVTLTDRSTTQARTAITDSGGRYAFVNLPAGLYDLSVTLSGFKTASVTGLAVETTRPVVRDVGLELGGSPRRSRSSQQPRRS